MDEARKKMLEKFRTVKWQGHPCGRGSLFKNTAVIRALLQLIVEQYNIKSISDAGAGDLSWIEHVEWPHQVVYVAYDLVPRHETVYEFDITSEILPATDLILCRYVLNHLPPDLELIALENFKSSGSKYLLTTYAVPDNDYISILGKQLERVFEKNKNGRDWYYALWKLTND